ncbi:efflux RND transporter permease subunit [uncultured Pseudoteredinibacter sp.]|uniref:efflux RND transporter permease subunit n=1 Tax=uncultured Pseudoteredinibacter sp. TaxID=1641701 RepID=UPI0026233A33|nr:efflux RND transporter permease subunit [uncultured Pseudoteredinibacter sp.]
MNPQTSSDKPSSGPISWMAQHRVAPNLLMLLFIIGGLFTSYTIQKEFLPSESAAIVDIAIEYPGATPTEMEQGVALPIENALQGMEVIKKTTSTIQQGSVSVSVELKDGADRNTAFQEVKQAIDRITTFPNQIERPEVSLSHEAVEVLELAIFGDLSLFDMKRLGEGVRLLLLEDDRLSKVDMRGLPAEEVHIDVPPQMLKRYNITLDEIAARIRTYSIEQSSGTVKTRSGNILVSVNDRQFWASQFSTIPILYSDTGDTILLRDIATVSEGFADTNELVTFNGKNGVLLNIFRTDSQTPTDVYDAYVDTLPKIRALLPPSVDVALTDNDAKTYTQRLSLLLKNAFIGLILVMITLALFLEHRLAFWVVMGIPTTFLGAIIFLPYFNVTINVISLFGFIIALGIVVDDAIIAGENIYANQQKGMSFSQAAVIGAKQISVPLSFAVITNIIAFLPLVGMPGQLGRMFGSAPIVVLLCFLISWIEALFILPAHLSHTSSSNKKPSFNSWEKLQSKISKALDRFIEQRYTPFIRASIVNPSVAIMLSLGVAVLTLSYALSGRMGFSIYPEIEGEWAVVTAELPNDASMSQIKQVRDLLESAALSAVGRSGGDKLLASRQAEIDGTTVEVGLYLTPSEVRPISSHELVRRWSEDLGDIDMVRSLEFDAERGGGPGNASTIELEIQHSDGRQLSQAIQLAESELRKMNGVTDIKSSFSDGIPQWDIRVNNRGRSLGLTSADIASQARNAFYGSRAIRQQRLSSEVTVLVRNNANSRSSQSDISNLLVKTPSGGFMKLKEIADIRQTRSPTEILRRDNLRVETLTVKASHNKDLPLILENIKLDLFPIIQANYQGISIKFSGNQEETSDGLNALLVGTSLALLAIFAALAIPLRSYSQPIIVMSIIPFAAVGALLGHLALGQSLSVISIQGILALSGVVINNSLIMTDFANKERNEGRSTHDAIIAAAIKRFRPIILTTVTTFLGLAPMVFETDRQAQMVIPMAVSLGFGILFTTFICLTVLPSIYIVVDQLFNRDSK